MKRVMGPVSALEALEKMRKWCAYQERAQQDARLKLKEFRLTEDEIENIIAQLISENFLNEERFAQAFARGKFRMKAWGKVKIRMALKQHGVSEPCIASALNQIDAQEYKEQLVKTLHKKLYAVNGDRRKRFHTVLTHVLGKGFESDLAIEELNVILDKEE